MAQAQKVMSKFYGVEQGDLTSAMMFLFLKVMEADSTVPETGLGPAHDVVAYAQSLVGKENLAIQYMKQTFLGSDGSQVFLK